MGLMDKVKQQAGTLAEKTQEGAKVAQGKIDQLQEKRKIDQLLHDLGELYYAQRQGKASPEAPAQMDSLISEIAGHEANLAQG
ncbi:MAG: hypothetical protein ACRDU0_11655 [Mycobacterium sp.]